MLTTPRLAAAFAALSFCAGCGGGGGGSPLPPTIVGAAFVGAGATPVAGELLIITVSKAVTLVPGSLLTDTDFTLSDGTLGAVTAPPVAVSSQSVRLTLGAGVSFTPGVTTIVFSELQDAVQSTDGPLATGGAPKVIDDGDGNAPALSNITLNSIDGELNGTGMAGGILLVPRSGFTIDIAFSDATTAVDPTRTFFGSSNVVNVGGADRAPGQDLGDGFVLTVGGGTASYAVPATVAFADGDHALTVIVTDGSGMSSAPVTFAFRVRLLDAGVRPFESTQVWFVDTRRDVEAIATNLTITAGGNGVRDLHEVYRAVGLHSASPGASATNSVVSAEIEGRILIQLASLFAGVPVTFTFTAPGLFPTNQTSVPYTSFAFSQMCIGGSATGSASEILGSAVFDANNTTQDDDCETAFGANQSRLGVFPHASLVVGFLSGPSSTFRMTYDTLTPFRSGTPIGDMAGDAARLSEVVAGTNTGGDPRITTMTNAIQRMARLLAVVTAHECGHSMGLVANSAPPAGLYGNDPINFPLSGGQPAENANGHIQNTSLFPFGAQNIMSPAIDFDAAQSASTVFNTLNRAYLRERAMYVPN